MKKPKRKYKVLPPFDGPLYDAGAVRAAMAVKQLTITALAEKTELTPDTVSAIRRGKDVRISNLKRVCKALEMSLAI